MAKSVICLSGSRGWQCKLRTVYNNRKIAFLSYSETYGLHQRLGYATAEAAWEANPTVQGSTNPSDYCRILKNGRRYRKPIN